MSTQARELPIRLQNNITVYLHHAIPLCIILADEKLYPWYCERFIQVLSMSVFDQVTEAGLPTTWPGIGAQLVGRDPHILSRTFSSGDVKQAFQLDFAGVHYHPVLSIDHVREPIERSIIDFIVSRINAGYYVNIHVDEYYLPDKDAFGAYHSVHPSLIYGYDMGSRKLLAIGFHANYLFTHLVFDLDVFATAYDNAVRLCQATPGYGIVPIELLRSKSFAAEYPFDVTRFLRQLHNYIFSTCDSSDYYTQLGAKVMLDGTTWQLAEVDGQVKFGLDVYDDFKAGLDDVLQGNDTLDYTHMHLLFEQKKSIAERVGFIIARYGVKGILVELLTSYQEVVHRFQLARFAFLKYMFSRDVVTLKEVMRIVDNVKREELLLLVQIYKQIHIECKVPWR